MRDQILGVVQNQLIGQLVDRVIALAEVKCSQFFIIVQCQSTPEILIFE
jgi:hypothetical protein